MNQRPKSQKIRLKEFLQLFYIQKLPNKKIAEYFNVGVSAIGSFRRRNKLKGRGWSIHPMKGKRHSKKSINKIKKSLEGKMVRDKNPFWKGGRYITYSGYVRLHKPEHPNNYKGYVLEHRYNMEKHLGRILDCSEIVHHKDGNKTNNKLSNLCLYSRSNHSKHHYPKGSKFGIHIKKMKAKPGHSKLDPIE